MKQISIVYKCKRCGELFEQHFVDTSYDPRAAIFLTLSENRFKREVEHQCGEDDIEMNYGIAEAIGVNIRDTDRPAPGGER